MEKTDKKILYQLIDKIEIDEHKNVYITFAFQKTKGKHLIKNIKKQLTFIKYCTIL